MTHCRLSTLYLYTRFNKIPIQGKPQMAVDKEAIILIESLLKIHRALICCIHRALICCSHQSQWQRLYALYEGVGAHIDPAPHLKQVLYLTIVLFFQFLLHYVSVIDPHQSIGETHLGAIKVLRNAFFRKWDPHPLPRNANNIESYTFVTIFSGKFNTRYPSALRNTWITLYNSTVIIVLKYMWDSLTKPETCCKISKWFFKNNYGAAAKIGRVMKDYVQKG